MRGEEMVRAAKLRRLKAALARGEADVASKRVIVIKDDNELEVFFAELIPPDSRRLRNRAAET
jgi:hypothetical protein